MNAQQLKNAILQEAITGRLVPQDPNDEPASVLLDKIRKEKAKLVKEGKLKKKDLIETPISKEEIPFEIPESWEWVRFFSIFNLETNLVKPNLYLDYPHIAPDNIEKGTGKLLNYRTVREDRVKSNNHLFYEGHIIYSKIRPLLRKAIIASFDGLCSADMYPLSTSINLDYALYYLLSDSFNYQVSNICSSRVKMPKINQEELSTIVIPLPPLSEQHRIVAKIKELLPKVEEYGKAQEALDKLNAELPERLKKSILQEAITGKLVPQDPNDEPASVLLDKIRKEKAKLVKEGKLKKKDLEEKPISKEEIPFEIPESWEWVRLQDITIYISRGKSPIYSEIRKYPIVAQKCNQWTGFSLEKAKFADPSTVGRYTEERLLQDGDLLWNSTGLGTLGRMAIYNSCVNEYGWAVADSHVTVIRTMPEFCYYKYLFYYFASHQVQNVIEDKSDGSTKQKELAQETVRKYEVPLPPLAEQHRIVAKIEELLSKIDKLKTK